MHNHFIGQMEWPEYWVIDHDNRFLTLISGSDFDTRTSLMKETLCKNYESQKVPALRHWANEEFLLYSSTGEHVLDLDGCGVDMFGIVNYSVHMIGWVTTAEGRKI